MPSTSYTPSRPPREQTLDILSILCLSRLLFAVASNRGTPQGDTPSLAQYTGGRDGGLYNVER